MTAEQDDLDEILIHREKTAKGLKVMGFTDEQLKTKLIGYVPPVSLKNELATWNLIKSVVNDRLKAYPTTVEQDNDIIERQDLENEIGTNKLNCVKFRRSEKVVLHLFKMDLGYLILIKFDLIIQRLCQFTLEPL